MGRKPKPGLKEAILAAAAEQQVSASMLHDAITATSGTAPTSLTGIIKAAKRLENDGMLHAHEAMPEAYRGARTRTYYQTTNKGEASLKDAIAAATAGWNDAPPTLATSSQKRSSDASNASETSPDTKSKPTRNRA